MHQRRSGKISQKNSRKRSLEKEIGEAPPSRLERVAGGARRSAPPRARTREIRAIKGNAAPFLLMLQSRCASESKRPPVQCCFDRGGIEVDPVPRCARPAPPTTPANPAPRRPHQPQPKLRNWRRRLTNVAGKISQKNSLKRSLEKEIGEAPPSRLERVAGGARRSAPPRARTREIRAIKGNAAPFLLMLQSRCASESKRPPVQCCFDRGGIEVDPVPRCARPAPPTTPANPAPRRPHQPQPKLRNWRRRLTNVAGKISQKNSLKRSLEKEIGEAPPSRLEQVAGGARRSAPPRARTREIRANKGNAAPFLLMLQSRCASESKRPPVQCCFDRGGIEVDPVPRCARPAPPTTPANPAPRRPHQPQPKLRNWRRRLTNVAGKISQKNSLKRSLEKEIGEAPPSRLERVAGGARRSAPPRARTREIRAIKGNAAPFLLMLQKPLREREQAPPISAVSIGVVSKSTPYLAALARRRRPHQRIRRRGGRTSPNPNSGTGDGG